MLTQVQVKQAEVCSGSAPTVIHALEISQCSGMYGSGADPPLSRRQHLSANWNGTSASDPKIQEKRTKSSEVDRSLGR